MWDIQNNWVWDNSTVSSGDYYPVDLSETNHVLSLVTSQVLLALEQVFCWPSPSFISILRSSSRSRVRWEEWELCYFNQTDQHWLNYKITAINLYANWITFYCHKCEWEILFAVKFYQSLLFWKRQKQQQQQQNDNNKQRKCYVSSCSSLFISPECFSVYMSYPLFIHKTAKQSLFLIELVWCVNVSSCFFPCAFLCSIWKEKSMFCCFFNLKTQSISSFV